MSTDEIPFASSKLHPRSDEEIAMFKALKKERSGKCFVYVFAGIVIQCIIILVLAVIVLRVKVPDVNLSLVTVKNLKYNGTASSTSFSATFVAEVTIKNKNFGGFKFENSTLSLLYRGMVIGERKIGHGRVKAREGQAMNVTVELRSNRLSDLNNLSSDINSGMLKLSSSAKLSGTVHLVKIIKKRRNTELNCIMTLNLTSRAVQDLQCQ